MEEGTTDPADDSQRAGDHDSIGIIGGTGPAGIALATRLALVGRTVVIGSRDDDRARAAASAILAEDGRSSWRLTGGTNTDAARCADVVLAVKADHTVAVAEAYRTQLDGRIVVSMASRLRRVARGFAAELPSGSSIAAAVQAVLPESRVVAALQHLPARQLGDVDSDIEADIMVCGDDAAAVATIRATFAALTNGRIMDAGPLANAVAIETLTAVLVTLNVRERAAYSIKLVDESATTDR